MNTYPTIRNSRIRHSSVRHLSEMSVPQPSKFIWPVFVVSGAGIKKPIESLPGQYYYSVDVLAGEVGNVIDSDIGGVLVFAVVDEEDRSKFGKYAHSDDGLAQKAIKVLRAEFPNLAIFGDIGLTGYTELGHAQVLSGERFDNDLSLEVLKKIAISHANAGATGIAPSGMIDGQVTELRDELDKNRYKDVLILSYSTKFNSGMYRTFPFDTSQAARSGLDRGDYLESYLNPKSAVRESLIDEQEGADMLMVKPALFYLDIIKDIVSKTNIPVAAYNVSGEYAMMCAMIEKGFADKNGAVKESLCALHRAGADIIISYWANQYDEIFT